MSGSQEQLRQMVAKRYYEAYKAIPKHKRTLSQQWHIDAWEAEEKRRVEISKMFGLEVQDES